MDTRSFINAQAERALVLQRLAQVVAQRPYVLVALTLYWTWVNMAFQGPLFFPPVDLQGELLLPSWVGPVAVSALTYFALALNYRRGVALFKHKHYIAALAALMTIGALAAFAWIELGESRLASPQWFALYLVGSLGIGCGTAGLLVEWGRVFGYLGPRDVLYFGIVAMLLSALLICVLSLFPAIVGRVIFLVIPLPLAWCWSHFMKNLPRASMLNHGLTTEHHLPIKFLITAFLHGLALGVLLGESIAVSTFSNTILLNALSFVAATILLCLTAIFVKMDFNHLIYQVGFGIMATGSLLLSLVGVPFEVGEVIQLIGFCYVHLIMWGLCSYLTKNFSLSSVWVVAWPTCFLMLGQLLGGGAASWLVQSDPDYWFVTIATLVTFVLLGSALVLISNKNLPTGWGVAKPGGSASADTARASAVHALITECGLTPRESDIFTLLANGRNRKYISAELTITEETVKSHISNIYRKLGVHTQQELLDKVEAQATAHQETPSALPLA